MHSRAVGADGQPMLTGGGASAQAGGEDGAHAGMEVEPDKLPPPDHDPEHGPEHGPEHAQEAGHAKDPGQAKEAGAGPTHEPGAGADEDGEHDPIAQQAHEQATSEQIDEAKQESGHAVEPQIKQKVEAATRKSLGDVRIHTHDKADAAARQVDAKAIAVGRDIFFAKDQYKPGTREGDRLLAEELVHTMQQRGASSSGGSALPVSQPGDASEKEAEKIADAVATSKPVSATSAQSRGTAPGHESKEPALQHPVSTVTVQRSFWGKIGGFFKKVGSGIATAVKAVGKTVGTVVKMVATGIKKIGSGVLHGVIDLGKGIGRGIGSLVKGVVKGIGGLGTAAWKLFTKGPKAAWQSLKGAGKSVWNGIVGAGKAVFSGARDFVNDTTMGIANAGLGIADHARDYWAAMGGYRDDPNQPQVKLQGEAFVNGASPTDVKQGALGDCYVLASLAAIARANPKHIEKLIKDNGDGTYDVTLYGDRALPFLPGKSEKTVRVSAVFPSKDGQKPVYAQSVESGARGPELWVLLFEKAMAEQHGSFRRIEGGFASLAMEELTGKRSQSYLTPLYGSKELGTTVAEALRKHHPVTASTHASSSKIAEYNRTHKTPIVEGHVYAPISVSGDRIKLQNPWGADSSGNSTDVELSLDEFKQFFLAVDVSQL